MVYRCLQYYHLPIEALRYKTRPYTNAEKAVTYDMYKALVQVPGMDKEALLQCYHAYMDFVVDEPPTQKVYLQNMEAKMQDDEFIGDIAALIRPTEKYDQATAYELVRTELLEKIEESKQKHNETKQAKK